MDYTAKISNMDLRKVQIVLLLACLALLFAGCMVKASTDATNLGLEYDVTILTEYPLTSSAKLYGIYSVERQYGDKSYHVALQKAGSVEVIDTPEYGEWIFYDQTAIDTDFEFGEVTNSLLCYLTIDGKDFVIPIIRVPKEASGDEILLFANSPYVDEVPADSLGSVPMRLQDENRNDGYPMWIFVLEADQIPDDYSLTYLGYTLTAEQISSHRWMP